MHLSGCVTLVLCFARSAAWGTRPFGIIVVDHGSRRAEANDALNDVVARYRAHAEAGGASPVAIEPAHMELASPTIAEAFTRCVESGAQEIVCAPFFLSPGRHVSEDIPSLMQSAAAEFPAIRWSIAAPLGAQPSMPALMDEAIAASRAAPAAQDAPGAPRGAEMAS